MTSKRASLSRSGKIAKLPLDIREEVNRRLLDGQDSTDILPWLNALAEVRERIVVRFAATKITPGNLSDWRRGGYADWLAARQAAK